MSWQQVCFDYDGSYPGFLTCVFESYAHREEAVCFTSPEEDHLTLWPERHVDTDQAKAERVYRSLSKKISPQACRLVTQAFLTCLPERELHMYRFLRLGYQRGADITRDLTDDRVHVLWKAVQHLGSEAHLLKGFLRFSDQQGVLVGEIEPKNRVLPLLRPHFCTRYSGEHFLIYDRTHRELLIHQPSRWAILPAEDFAPAPPGQEEVTYRRLWRRFYDTIAIRPPPLLHPVLRGALPHLRPHPPGAADPSAQSVGHSARGRLCPCPAGAGGGDLPASVEAVL
ncbi:TIGR03915 family putative DNA repair protein [Clostridium phoceensis]|uniref:TIGR03915 family putative DNA repair protein n=1 Tax=Clostridium phoceensis TaxID=1650661 RepID=UPI00067F67CD